MTFNITTPEATNMTAAQAKADAIRLARTLGYVTVTRAPFSPITLAYKTSPDIGTTFQTWAAARDHLARLVARHWAKKGW